MIAGSTVLDLLRGGFALRPVIGMCASRIPKARCAIAPLRAGCSYEKEKPIHRGMDRRTLRDPKLNAL
jgi:hypothetical protein